MSRVNALTGLTLEEAVRRFASHNKRVIVATVLTRGKLLYCRNRKTLATDLMHITAPIRRHDDFLVRQGVLRECARNSLRRWFARI